jgi:phosphopantetheinyl transferase
MAYMRTTDREKVPDSTFYLTRGYLLASIVVIDAVRDFLWKQGNGPIYPIEIRVKFDDNNRPVVSGPFENDLRASYSEKEGTAVACVGEGVEVGIELERIEERAQGFVDAMFTPAEIDILTKADCLSESLRDEWVTRAWCAKEAVAKQKDGGLKDNFRKWRFEEISGERLRIDGTWVNSRREGDYVIAWTEKP